MLAAQHHLGSISFPAISTGVYRFPPDRAARIAVGTVVSELAGPASSIKRVIFCCFSDESAQQHRAVFTDLGLA
jgi:O-acetyl-ADP-ribose deacetylase (regulator of RNase III)